LEILGGESMGGGILEILKIKKPERKVRKVYVLYQTDDVNLPSGVEVVRIKILGYRCGKEDICPQDGKTHRGQKLHQKDLKKRCLNCKHLEITVEK